MHIVGDGRWNGDMLRCGRDLRAYSTRQLCADTGIPKRAMYRYIAGDEPTPEHLAALSEVLQLPRNFFYRAGDYPERDERYPLDMYKLKPKRPPPTRADIAALVALIPEHELPALYAYMHDVAEYPENVTRIDEDKP